MAVAGDDVFYVGRGGVEGSGLRGINHILGVSFDLSSSKAIAMM